MNPYRFVFLRNAMEAKQWTTHPFSPVNKTMVWDMSDVQVWWEYHDGLKLEDGQEPIERLALCYEARDKNKPFVYVKPRISATQCDAFYEMARQEGFPIITCPKWSWYHENYYIMKELSKIRRIRRERLSTHFNGRQHFLFTGNVEHPGRKIWLDRAQTTWGDDFQIASFPQEATVWAYKYIEIVAGSSYTFQPHGVGPRHQIYESMAMGVPSIIPENSFLDDHVRSCCVIVNDELPTDLPIPGTLEYQMLSERCIDTWDTYHKPEAIVDNVLDQIKTMGFKAV